MRRCDFGIQNPCLKKTRIDGPVSMIGYRDIANIVVILTENRDEGL